VLLVTGAYFPEVSAGGVLCRSIARALSGRCRFTVLTTSVDPSLAPDARVDGVDVHRVPIDVRSLRSRLAAFFRVTGRMVRLRRDYDLVHLHGVSQKNVAATAVARLFRKPIVVTLHTAGQEEPSRVRRRGALHAWALSAASRVWTVSPLMTMACREAGFAAGIVEEMPNAVDLTTFAPAGAADRARERRSLRLPEDARVMLVVGFFSRDKRPQLAFDVFASLASRFPSLVLVFVGATGPSYYEIDAGLAAEIRARAERAGLSARVIFREPTTEIERYYRSADVVLVPSARESFSLVLLEAMASGVPAVASRIAGATDQLLDDGVTGRLVTPDDVAGFAEAVGSLLAAPDRAASVGAAARVRAAAFDVHAIAERWLAGYRDLIRATA
jgi:glycosyltransferase involved in cell wall biosynthesis